MVQKKLTYDTLGANIIKNIKRGTNEVQKTRKNHLFYQNNKKHKNKKPLLNKGFVCFILFYFY